MCVWKSKSEKDPLKTKNPMIQFTPCTFIYWKTFHICASLNAKLFILLNASHSHEKPQKAREKRWMRRKLLFCLFGNGDASTLSLSLLFCFRFTIIFPHFPSLAQLFSVFSWKMIFQFIWDTHTSNVNMWENSHSIILVTAWHFFMHALKFLTRRRKILI